MDSTSFIMSSRSNDELVITVDEPDKIFEISSKFQARLREDPRMEGLYLSGKIRMEDFQLIEISTKYPYFIRKIIGKNATKLDEPELVMKGVNPEHYAVCYKHVHDLPIDHDDIVLGGGKEWNVEDLKLNPQCTISNLCK